MLAVGLGNDLSTAIVIIGLLATTFVGVIEKIRAAHHLNNSWHIRRTTISQKTLQHRIYIHLKSYESFSFPVVSTEKRPWGKFERFTLNEQSTVKLVYLDGDKRLSLQYHNNRSEFWKVIRGPVKVQLGNDTKTLQTGETITIPNKAVHRLIGAGTDAIILEISIGEFDESDIVRLEDDYKRQ